MNKLIAALLLLVTAFAVAGCGAKPLQESSEIANPWTDWNTLQEAEDAVGFSFDLPETVAGTYTAASYRTMDGDIKLLEVVYHDPDCEVTVRKAQGENRDISGVYDHDMSETQEWRGTQVVYSRKAASGNAANSLLVTLSRDGYSWSLYAPNGFWGASCYDFLIEILE